MTQSFTLRLLDATHTEEIADVTSFVGADASGSFGVLAGHSRMMTALTMGLARFRLAQRDWKYVAASGGLLYMNDNVLSLSARLYLVDDDYTRISRELQEKLLVDEERLQKIKESLHRMEREVLERLWQMSRTA